MVDTGVFATTAEILRKAGAGASAASSDDAYTNQFVAEAESYINVLTRNNYTTGYAGLDASVKSLLKEAASNLAAIYVIMYDTSGYGSTRIAENNMNILWKRFLHCIKLLNDEKATEFVDEAT